MLIAPKKCPEKSLTLFGPSGGGTRKTKATLLHGSAIKACGRDVLFVCADPGIGSLSKSLKVGGPHHVEYFPTGEDPNYAMTLMGQLENKKVDHALIDLGANALLGAAAIRTTKKAIHDLTAAGYEIFVVLSIISGKTGLVDDVTNFAKQFSSVADVRLAFHGNARLVEAENYSHLTDTYLSYDVPEDEPAILRLINEAGVTPFDWCQSAPHGFQMAAGLMAHNLITLAEQRDILPMIDPSAVTARLSSIAAQRPKRRFQPLTEPRNVRDTVLRANESLLIARSRLHGRSIDDSDAVLADATRQYLKAVAAAASAK